MSSEVIVMDDTLFYQYDNEDYPEQFVTFFHDLIGDHQHSKDVKESMSLYKQSSGVFGDLITTSQTIKS